MLDLGKSKRHFWFVVSCGFCRNNETLQIKLRLKPAKCEFKMLASNEHASTNPFLILCLDMRANFIQILQEIKREFAVSGCLRAINGVLFLPFP